MADPRLGRRHRPHDRARFLGQPPHGASVGEDEPLERLVDERLGRVQQLLHVSVSPRHRHRIGIGSRSGDGDAPGDLGVVGAGRQHRRGLAPQLERSAPERRVDAGGVGEGHGDRHVLDHQIEGEPRVVGAGEHEVRPLVLGRPAPPARRVDDVEHDGEVEPERFGGAHRLARRQQVGGRHQVVECLHRVPGAGVADVDDPGAQLVEDRAHAGDGRGVAADHDRERAGRGGAHTARHWRVHHRDPVADGLRGESSGAHRFRRSHVDDHLARRERVERPGFDEHRLDRVRVRQHQHHDVGALGHRTCRGLDLHVAEPDETLSGAGVDVVDLQRPAGGGQPLGHHGAHPPEADEPDDVRHPRRAPRARARRRGTTRGPPGPRSTRPSAAAPRGSRRRCNRCSPRRGRGHRTRACG